MQLNKNLSGDRTGMTILQCRDTRDRTMVFVDLENACGGSDQVATNQSKVRKIVQMIDPIRNSMIVFSTGSAAIAACPNLLWEWSGARFIMGHGLDGADHCLITSLLDEPMARRSEKVVLISGDGIFTTAISELGKQGIHTVVLASPRSLAKSLRLVANEVLLLEDFESDSDQISSKEKV